MNQAKHEQLSSLYQKYQQRRESKLSQEQFVPFVVFFPSLLVILSDGIIDPTEWEYVQQLSRFMAKSYTEDMEKVDTQALAEVYLIEISYLTRHLPEWKAGFLEALLDYKKAHPEVERSIIETMELFAEASEGTSQEEDQAIKDIKKSLEITV